MKHFRTYILALLVAQLFLGSITTMARAQTALSPSETPQARPSRQKSMLKRSNQGSARKPPASSSWQQQVKNRRDEQEKSSWTNIWKREEDEEEDRRLKAIWKKKRDSAEEEEAPDMEEMSIENTDQEEEESDREVEEEYRQQRDRSLRRQRASECPKGETCTKTTRPKWLERERR